MHLLPRQIPRRLAEAHSRPLPPQSILEGNDPITVAAAFVAAQTDGPGKILRLHTRGPDGYCSWCRVRPVRWPCPIGAIALLALKTTKAERGSNTPAADSPRDNAP
jgi:hypothetical protein